MRKKNRFVVFLTAILLMAAVLGGCKDGKTGQGGNDTPDSSNISKEEPSYGGSVVVGITQDLDSLDPHKAVAAGTKEVLFNVFEGLVKPDEAGNLIPAVASDYHMSDDGKIYTFTLRDGIQFHNKKLVTVNDIVYSVKRCAGLLGTLDQEVVVEPALSNIEKVEAEDDKTVKITLKEGNTEILGYLTCAIIPEDYDNQSREPIGTGPFKFVSYSPLEHFTVEKNEDYWMEGVPYLDKVTFKISANTDTAFMELKSGAMDIFPYLTDDQAEQLPNEFAVMEGNMNLVQGLFLNNKTSPFDNPDVRRALNYAIDKRAVLDMVAGGRGDVLGSNMFPGFSKYYLDALKDYYPYDSEKAKQLLKEAGYHNNLEFIIKVPSNYQYHVATAEVIVEQLRAAGIQAKIQQIDWSQWIREVYTDRNFQATIVGLDAKLAPRDVMERYISDAYNNFMNYENEEYDRIAKEAINEIDDNKKVERYKELQTLLTQDAASVYIQDPALLVAVNKKLGGYSFYPVYVQDMAKVYYKK